MNCDLTEPVNFGSANPASRAYRSESAQSVANASVVKIQFNAESYDITNSYDPDTNYRFTAPYDGYYSVVSYIHFTAFSSDGYAYIMIYKNGVEYSSIFYQSTGTVGFEPSVHDLIPLEINDYIEIYTYQVSGQARNIANSVSETYFTTFKIGGESWAYSQIDCAFSELENPKEYVTSSSTEATFYIDKTINYGDILTIFFISIFAIYFIVKEVSKLVFKND